LPREIGNHPETGKAILAGIGRYGPFVQHDGVYANLETPEEVFEVGINRAVTVLAEKKTKRGSRQATILKDLGEHPELGGTIQVLDGKYGPYVKHAKINATLPKSIKPEEMTIEQAVELIAVKAAKGKGSSKGKSKAGTKKSKSAKPSAKEAAS
jgi:DNA topoisomerase-1